MIYPSHLSQLPLDSFILGSVGYALGRLSQLNAKLSAAVLAIHAIANNVFFYIADRTIRCRLDISSEALYTGSNAFISVITCLAARQLDLISRQMAGLLIFISAAIFLGRLRIIATGNL